MTRIALLLTGGAHQSLHLLPLVAEFRKLHIGIEIFAIDKQTSDYCLTFLNHAGVGSVAVSLLEAGLLERLLLKFSGRSQSKSLRLIHAAWRFREFEALIVAERTSTVLKRYRLTRKPLIHIPHGAGDRRAGFDPRARLYDFHVVSGDKDLERFISERIAEPDNIAVSGSIKLASVCATPVAPPPLFPTARPVVLYAPHFDRTLSSWHRLGPDLLERLVADQRFNVIFAPHMRLRSTLSPEELARIERCASPRVHVDLGSARSYDMTYTRAADIYLGDVSSQVYEFLVEPRPCVFLNTIGARVNGNPDFRMWLLGDVITDVPSALDALHKAFKRHPDFIERQRLFFHQTMGRDWEQAPQVAARQIVGFLDRRHLRPHPAAGTPSRCGRPASSSASSTGWRW